MKDKLIREMIRNIDWLEQKEALFRKLGLDRKHLNAVYMAGLEVLSELNDGRFTMLKEFKALQWKMRYSELMEFMTIDLKLYQLHSNIKSLLNRV
jgi:hypothetical protein